MKKNEENIFLEDIEMPRIVEEKITETLLKRAFSETPLHPSLRLIFRQKSSNLIDVHSMYAS